MEHRQTAVMELSTRAGQTMGQDTRAALELRDVHKQFGGVCAVDGISLVVEPGEIVAFLGPNGAGKTTTIDMMLGLARPDSGSVAVFGGTPASAIARGRVSAVLQSGGLLHDMSVAETVRLTASLFADPRPVAEVLDRAGILDLADRRVGKCSGGQQQRLRFAMALLPEPDLLVLDEPTTGIDVQGRRDFWAAIRGDAPGGPAVVFATHYLDEADAYADRIVMLAGGRIVADGTPAQIKDLASGRVVTATLPGASEAGLAAVEGVDAVQLRGDRVILNTRDGDAVARYLLSSTSAADVQVCSPSLEDAFIALTRASQGHQRAASPGRAR